MPVLTSSISGKRPVHTLMLTVAVGSLSAAALTACSSSGTTATGGTGMKTAAHVTDNAEVAAVPPLSGEQVKRLFSEG